MIQRIFVTVLTLCAVQAFAQQAFIQQAPAQKLSPAVFAYSSKAEAEPAMSVPSIMDSVRTTANTSGQKSRALGLIYSALLPGMGELYADDYSAGRYFTVSEALLWLGYAGMTIFGNSLTNDAMTYATVHSGANMNGKSDQFLTDVGNFTNTEQYNEKKAGDGTYSLIYTTSDYNWQWDNDADRTTFRSMHLRANTILDNTKYVLAAVVVNHIASIIDAILAVNKYNSSLKVGFAPTQEFGSAGGSLFMQYQF
ncbi:MAG TPA: hypothetical protein VFJ29_02125 [Candidatus Kapabacteria bacterium]|nr:hypothetical protein [Candidatus Kapabacteria bacterium]